MKSREGRMRMANLRLQSLGEPKSRSVLIKLTPTEKRLLKRQVEAAGMTMMDYVASLIWGVEGAAHK